MAKKERVLVVGGGFGGVKASLELAPDTRFDVTLLTDSTDLRYYPTLYHTATGGRRRNSSIPLLNIFEDLPITIVKGNAATLDRKSKTIVTSGGKSYEFDSLIVGLGVVTNYFGIKGMREYSYTIKTQDEVARFKTHLHQQLLDDKKPDLNYVVVGAGATGIELAGELPTYIRQIMKNHGLPRRAVHVDLIEALPRLLPRLPKDAARSVARRLRKLGVKSYVGNAVQASTADELLVNGKPIRSHTVVWTAGVTNHPFFSDNSFVIMNSGKVATDIYLQAEENIFVIGDNANTPFSGMAQTALRDGTFVANNLKRRASGKPFKSYEAKQPVIVIPAGPRWALVIWGKLRIYGKLGYLVREAADLVGFHHLEPWDKAAKQFMTEFSTQDNCPVCATALSD